MKSIILFLCIIFIYFDINLAYYEYNNRKFLGGSNRISGKIKRPETPLLNSRPIIGILSHEISQSLHNCLSNYNGITPNYKSYIAASYVKFIESAGARVVPIRIGESYNYYKFIANSVNGILFPGGGAQFTANNGYADAAKLLYSFAVTENIPLWGTCLGFEIIVVLAAGNDFRHKCSVNNVAGQLKFRPESKISKLFRDIPLDILNILQNQPVTANTHTFCISVQNMTDFNMTQHWQILTTTTENNHTFVSSIESKQHLIWGVQFHPEKNSFEWNKSHVSHSSNAIKAGQYFSNFFVNEARKNNNSFPSNKLEQHSLIYNYRPIFTSKLGCSMEQCYLFT